MDKRPFPSGMEVSAALLHQLAAYVGSLGIDPRALVSAGGLDPSLLDEPDARIRSEDYLSIQEEAVRLSGDECFGLHMGEFAQPGSYSVVGFIMMNCRTLGEAFSRASRYYRIIGTMIDVKGRLEGGRACAVLHPARGMPAMSRHCFESTLSSTVRLMRILVARDVSPLEVRFAHDAPSPASRAEYERIFRCPVSFGQRENSLLLELSALALPVAASNRALLPHLEEYASRLLERLAPGRGTSREVAAVVSGELGKGNLGLPLVARRLGMGTRTLQGRLRDEGTEFSAILRQVREELAKSYLGARYPVEDIAFLLGFSDPSAFRKAFKKWMGMTPGDFRSSSASGGSEA